jgi:hypothetical protein
MEAAGSSETMPLLCEIAGVMLEKTVNVIFVKSF